MVNLQNKYDLLNPISKSRESDVFLIRKIETSELFLLKSIKQSEKGETRIDLKKRFYREMDIVSSLDHPNIAKPHDTIVDSDTFSIIYPYERGDTLAQLFQIREKFQEHDALHITKQLLNALSYIHGHGIIHSDINPHNIFITEKKGLQVLDFGYSMTEDEARKTPEGRIIGTFPYLSPEQMGFTKFKIDTRSDLYCIMVILYRMLAGKLPFPMKEESLKELLDATLKREIMAIKHVPKFINSILLKGLRATPSDRYQTAEGFLSDVDFAIDKINSAQVDNFIAGQKDAVAAINRKRLFIVRENELEQLCLGLGHLLKGKSNSFLIYGKSGIGKTEIVREFKAHVDDNKFDFISAKSNRFTPSQPYSIFRQLIIELLLKISAIDKESRKIFKAILNTELAGYSGIICSIIPEMREWFDKIGEIDVIEKEKESDRINHVLSVLFTTLCNARKLVVFVDDLQWIDRITFNIIKRSLEQKSPGLLICNYRTSEQEDQLYSFGLDLKTLGFDKLIHIKPFTKTETTELVLTRFGAIEKSDDLIHTLHTKTDGVPFVLTEAIRYLVNNGMLNIDSKGWSFKQQSIFTLPEKFDSVSLIISKLKVLAPEEKKFLQLASLIEGKFDCEIIEKLGGFPFIAARSISARLENIGFIAMQLKGGFSFIHDRVQESIVSGIPSDDRLAYYEVLGKIYFHKAETDKESIFNAAECYLKSKNMAKAMEICYQAAVYATEKIAFDVAIRYFKNAVMMVDNAAKVGLTASIDLIKLNIALGDVLMLTGANEQALKVFGKLNEDLKLDQYQRLEVKYKIGAIYHNLGEFDKSAPCFYATLQEMGINIPKKRFLILFATAIELCIQILFSLGIKKIVIKKNDSITLLKSRILNKLSYSLYFSDMIKAFFVHFKALNLADMLIDCFEKSEAYSLHQVPIYQMLLKRRAFKYLAKSILISNKIHRFDSLAFAQSFGGIAYFFNADWKKCEDILNSSNYNFEKIGDIAGQITNAKHIWKINISKGLFNNAFESAKETIALSKKANEKYFLVIAMAALNLVNFLKEGIHNFNEYNEIDKNLENIDSFLFHVEAGGYLLETEILTCKLDKAYNRANKLLPLIFKNCINSEYQVRTHSLFCCLIIVELLNRLKGNTQINASNKQLKQSFIINSFILWFSCLSYPAYWGSFYRNIAWFLAMIKRKTLARLFFKKAIKCHHELDMRYEEACSIRDYGMFMEDFCNLPGKARDMFTKAYELYAWCGAKFETDKLEDKIHPSIKRHTEISKTPKTDEEKDSSESASSSGVNQIRIDSLLDTSASMTEIDDINALLRQIVSSMITATGAQYGYLSINENALDGHTSVAMSFEGKEVDAKTVPVFYDLIEKVIETQKIQIPDEVPVKEDSDTELAKIRSDLCVPLNWRDKYLGYVYLVNDKVQGLFGEGAQKAAQILAAQAGILLENAHLMGQYKELNAHLQQKVQDQTKDIMEKNIQLEESNLKIVDSERMKNLLSGTLVHDIKNYVAGIEGNVKLLGMRFPDNDKIQRTSTIVSNCCVDIINLTSNLLDIAKMEEGKLEIKKEQLAIEQIYRIIDKFKNNDIFPERGLTIEVKLPDRQFVIEADSYLLERILQNLFSNAAKYAPKGGTIVLSFEPGEKESVISFYNSGPPITEENKATLFEKYSRLDDKHSQYSKGLGLFFCRMVMNAHGGRIWLDTDPTGNAFKMSFKTAPYLLINNEANDPVNGGKIWVKKYAKAM
jgi:serine/threonine protein kinase/signal transduction histidine kinase/tetratricopeptide (TPR) repeat protein